MVPQLVEITLRHTWLLRVVDRLLVLLLTLARDLVQVRFRILLQRHVARRARILEVGHRGVLLGLRIAERCWRLLSFLMSL